jgi:peptide-methionine (S)-S-oxide reductase
MNTIRVTPLLGCLGLLPVLGFWTAGCTLERQQPVPLIAEQQTASQQNKEPSAVERTPNTSSSNTELATFGCGCFWCVEAIFQQLEGVLKVESGYSGGQVENSTYEAVCSGETGHAEVCQVTFDPAKVRFDDLLEVFWQTHDPTTLNQQGYDVGTQYRSAVFYHNEQQRTLAEKYKRDLDSSGAFAAPIVTEITPFKTFYKAENYHQNYFRENADNRYCQAIIQPKVEKFRKVFAGKVKKE